MKTMTRMMTKMATSMPMITPTREPFFRVVVADALAVGTDDDIEEEEEEVVVVVGGTTITLLLVWEVLISDWNFFEVVNASSCRGKTA